MKVEEIEKLLIEFYEGSTTDKEETILKEYFETQEVPERLKNDQKLFMALHANCKVQVPDNLEATLNKIIDSKAEEEKRFFRINRAKRNWKWIGGMAASLLILIGMAYSISNFAESTEKPKDTFTDPQEAYKILQATLIEVSTDMNSGINQLTETRWEMKKINKEIKKEIQ